MNLGHALSNIKRIQAGGGGLGRKLKAQMGVKANPKPTATLNPTFSSLRAGPHSTAPVALHLANGGAGGGTAKREGYRDMKAISKINKEKWQPVTQPNPPFLLSHWRGGRRIETHASSAVQKTHRDETHVSNRGQGPEGCRWVPGP